MAARCAIYVRISQDREGSGLGVERQQQDCEQLADKLGWEVGQVFVDNDVSAYSGKGRPAYSDLLAALDAGRFSGVLAWHPDRLHRSPIELEHYIDLTERRRVATHTVQAGAWDLSTPSGRAVARTLGAWARYESEHKAERISRARQQSATAGRFHGGRRPFGFERDGVTIRPDEAQVVIESTEAVVAGASLRSLVRALNERGVPTASGNGLWTSSSLADILKRPRNAGFSVHKGEIVGRGDWPPLVAEDLWRGVVATLSNPSRRTSPGGAVRWLGSGLYLCGVCGQAKLRASTSGSKRKPAYQCAAREVGDTTGHVVRDCALLDEYVERVVVTRLSEPGLLGSLNRGEGDSKAIQLEIVAIDQRLSELAEAFAAGEITRAQMGTASKSLRDKRSTLTDEMAERSVRNPLVALASGPSVEKVWFGTHPDRSDGLPLDSRRSILRVLADVTVLPANRRERGATYFNPDYVRIDWRGADQ